MPDITTETRLETLLESITKVLPTLIPMEERVLRMRLGINVDRCYTFDEIASLVSLSRARIQQIESKAIKKLQHPIRQRQANHFQRKFDMMINETSISIYLDQLQGINWFSGLNDIDRLERIVLAFAGSKVSIVSVNDRKLVSKSLNNTKFTELVNHLDFELRGSTHLRLDKESVEQRVYKKCLKYNAPEMKPVIWDLFSHKLVFAKSNGGKEILVATKTSSPINIIKFVLEEAGSPLHHTEVHRRVSLLTDKSVDARRVYNFLIQDKEIKSASAGFYTFSKARINSDNQEFILNEEVVSLKRTDTEKVSKLLHSILEDKHHTEQTGKTGLNSKLFDFVTSRKLWDKAELSEYMRGNGVMLGSFIEQINDWSLEKYGDILIEDNGDKIVINEGLLWNGL